MTQNQDKMPDILDMQMILIWINNPKATLKAIKEYSEEIKQTPNLKDWKHRFNITRRIKRQNENSKKLR